MGNRFQAGEQSFQHREGQQNTSKGERTWERLQKPGIGESKGVEMI